MICCFNYWFFVYKKHPIYFHKQNFYNWEKVNNNISFCCILYDWATFFYKKILIHLGNSYKCIRHRINYGLFMDLKVIWHELQELSILTYNFSNKWTLLNDPHHKIQMRPLFKMGIITRDKHLHKNKHQPIRNHTFDI